MKRSLAWLLLAACGPAIDTPLDTTAATSTTTAGTTTTESPTTSVDATSSTDAAPQGSGIGLDPDGGQSTIACDVWAQDCPRGEKCMPYANDGGGAWNAAKCSPIAADARAPGEPCTVVDSVTSGIDDCERGAMCWHVDAETSTGECVEMCHGTGANPLCSDPCDGCSISDEHTLILCLPGCDPLVQDCGPGNACYPIGNASFECVPDNSGDGGQVGDSCVSPNDCAPGNVCASAGAVPGCVDASGCCTSFCNASAADSCDELLPGTSCLPWFEDGHSPAACIGPGIIGACLVPR